MRLWLSVLALLAGVAGLSAQQRPALALSQLTWFDRAGKSLGTIGPLADHGNIELSPDNERVASSVTDQSAGARDVWSYPTRGGSGSRLTSSPADENWMVWSSSGTRAIVNAFGREHFDLFDMPFDARGPLRKLTTDDEARWPVSLSPDGKFLLCVTNGARTGNDIWVLSMTGDQPPSPFQRTNASENWATFSPDGKYVAFSSTEDGTPEVYVTAFPGPGPKWRVSADIGTQTRWRSPNELIYIDGEQRLVAVTLRVADGRVEAENIAPLFEIRYPYGAYHAFDVARDGRRILVNSVVLSGREPGAVASVDVPVRRPGL